MKTLVTIILFTGILGLFACLTAGDDVATPRAPIAVTITDAGLQEVIAVRYLTLKEGIEPAEFERFVTEEFSPALRGRFPGIDGMILKGDRGINAGKYVYVLNFQSVHVRDYYFPSPETPPTDAWIGAMASCGTDCAGILDALAGYIVETSDDYTDYVQLIQK